MVLKDVVDIILLLFFLHILSKKIGKQAWTVLGQAQLKLELELYFTSFKICSMKLIQLVDQL